MGIKRLTRAAEAAGYAMVHAEDIAPDSDTTDVKSGDQTVSGPTFVRAEIRPNATASYAAVAQQWLGAVVGRSAT